MMMIIMTSYATVRASLEAQMVKNLPAMQETQVQSLGWEGPLEKGVADSLPTELSGKPKVAALAGN